jgi:hypothetical protein
VPLDSSGSRRSSKKIVAKRIIAPARLGELDSQVLLKNFYSPAVDGLMYAVGKSDLKRFTPKSQDVCRIEEGSTNPFLTEERAIEEFLKVVEPRYNRSLAKLRENKMDQESIASIAGFAAYVITDTKFTQAKIVRQIAPRRARTQEQKDAVEHAVAAEDRDRLDGDQQRRDGTSVRRSHLGGTARVR